MVLSDAPMLLIGKRDDLRILQTRQLECEGLNLFGAQLSFDACLWFHCFTPCLPGLPYREKVIPRL